MSVQVGEDGLPPVQLRRCMTATSDSDHTRSSVIRTFLTRFPQQAAAVCMSEHANNGVSGRVESALAFTPSV